MVLVAVLLALYTLFSSVKNMHDAYYDHTDKDLRVLTSQVSKTLRELNEALNGTVMYIAQDSNYKILLSEIEKQETEVNSMFKNYLQYKANESLYSSETLKLFSESVLNPDRGMTHVINEMWTVLFDSSGIIPMLKSSLKTHYSCSTKVSKYQFFYQLLFPMLVTAAKAHTIERYAVLLEEKITNQTLAGTKQLIETNYNNSFITIAQNFNDLFQKSTVSLKPMKIRNCDLNKKHILGETYTQFYVFQRVIYDALELNHWGDDEKCGDFCGTVDTSAPNCGNNCQFTRYPCKNVQDCEEMSDSTICMNTNPDTAAHRYLEVKELDNAFIRSSEYITPNWLLNRHCDGDKKNVYRTFSHSKYTCRKCQCICADNFGLISTADVVSNITSNNIVTGVRFMKEGETLYMAIQQGKLGSYGFVTETSDWTSAKHIESSGTFALSWEARKVNLDKLVAPENHVLTGVKFDSDKLHTELKLKIQVTPYNFTTGKLSPKGSYWISSQIPSEKRKLIDVETFDVPTAVDVINEPVTSDLITSPPKYTQFTTTNFKNTKDVGNSTIPFIDMQPVVTYPPVATAGVGLDIIQKGKSAGYLQLALFTFNVSTIF